VDDLEFDVLGGELDQGIDQGLDGTLDVGLEDDVEFLNPLLIFW
jgi:hypothetical protein